MVSREIPRNDSREKLADAERAVDKLKKEVDGQEAFGVFDEFIGPLPEGEIRYSDYAQAREGVYESEYDAKGEARAFPEGDGKFRDASTGQFASEPGDYDSNKYYNEKFENTADSEKSYEDMTLQELAKKWGENDRIDDQSTVAEILTVIDDKIREKSESMGWSKETLDLHYATLADIADRARSTEGGDNREANPGNVESREDIAIPEEVQEKLKGLRARLAEALAADDTAEEYSILEEMTKAINSIEGISDETRQKLLDGISIQEVVGAEVDSDVESDAKPSLEFVIGSVVTVERTSGDRENGWTVTDILTRSDGTVVYEVSRPDSESDGDLVKNVSAENLASWQSGPEAEAVDEDAVLEKIDISDLEDDLEKIDSANKWQGAIDRFRPSYWASRWNTSRFMKRQIHDEMTPEEQNKRKNRNRVLFFVGGVALGILATKGYDLIQDAMNSGVGADSLPTDIGTGTGAEAGGDLGVDTGVDFGADNGADIPLAPDRPDLSAQFNIAPGDGGIALFNRLGLTEAQWYEAQGDLISKFPSEFYQPDGMAVRINSSGPLSSEAQEYIRTRFNI